jgi:hypothetical protein
MLDIKRTKLPNGGILSEWPDGTTIWSLNNKWHREDGPAVEWPNGDKRWCLNGQHIPCATQEEFERLMKLRAFW